MFMHVHAELPWSHLAQMSHLFQGAAVKGLEGCSGSVFSGVFCAQPADQAPSTSFCEKHERKGGGGGGGEGGAVNVSLSLGC